MGLIGIFAWIGVLTFAAMGALAAVEPRFDLVGVTVLAGVAAVGGGSIRDVVVGYLPPAIFRDEAQRWGVLAVALPMFWFRGAFGRLERPIYGLDTLGLGLFAALGAERGLAAGLGFRGTVFAGTVSGVGGGVLKDIFHRPGAGHSLPASRSLRLGRGAGRGGGLHPASRNGTDPSGARYRCGRRRGGAPVEPLARLGPAAAVGVMRCCVRGNHASIAMHHRERE
jgi:hypothetical protein